MLKVESTVKQGKKIQLKKTQKYNCNYDNIPTLFKLKALLTFNNDCSLRSTPSFLYGSPPSEKTPAHFLHPNGSLSKDQFTKHRPKSESEILRVRLLRTLLRARVLVDFC